MRIRRLWISSVAASLVLLSAANAKEVEIAVWANADINERYRTESMI